MRNKIIKKIKNIGEKIKPCLDFLVKLGLISVLFSIVTFWIMQYNNYVETDNNLKIETLNNLSVINSLGAGVGSQELYFSNLSNIIYKESWNHIVQYYNKECEVLFRSTSLNINTFNQLYFLRLGDKENQTYASGLNVITEKLKNQLQQLRDCKVDSFRPIHQIILDLSKI